MFPVQLRNSFHVRAWLVRYCHLLAWHAYYRTSLVCVHRDRFRYLSICTGTVFVLRDRCPAGLQPLEQQANIILAVPLRRFAVQGKVEADGTEQNMNKRPAALSFLCF